MAIKVQLRNDTAAAWSAANPVLMKGEIGIENDTGKIKVGNGVTAWNSLPYSLTGPVGPQGEMGPPNLALTGPILSTAAGNTLKIELANRDSYVNYTVSALTGSVSLAGKTITYIAQAIGVDTLTITADDVSRSLSINVTANSLGQPPAPAPAIGSPLEGGYYAGAVWDTATTATGSYAVGTGSATLTILAPDLPKFYVGQPVRLAAADARNGLMEGVVVSGSGDQITVNLTQVLGGNVGTVYSSWVIAVPWKIIVAPKASGEVASIQYKASNTADPAACRTLTNGPASTAAMQAQNSNPLNVLYPAAWWVSQINAAGGIGGYADWYLPARDELELLWRNFKPVTNANYTAADRPNGGAYTRDANISDKTTAHGENLNSYPAGAAYTSGNPAQTAVALFQAGQAEALTFGSAYYWSSSEFSATIAWYQSYGSSTPGHQSGSNKGYNYRARAVRRSIL